MRNYLSLNISKGTLFIGGMMWLKTLLHKSGWKLDV